MTTINNDAFKFDVTDAVEPCFMGFPYKRVSNPEFVAVNDEAGPCDHCVFIQTREGKGATEACECAQRLGWCVCDDQFSHFERI